MEVDLMLQSANSSASLTSAAAAGAITDNNAASSAVLNDESLQSAGSAAAEASVDPYPFLSGAHSEPSDVMAGVIGDSLDFFVAYLVLGLLYCIVREMINEAMKFVYLDTRIKDRPLACLLVAWPLILCLDLKSIGLAITASLSKVIDEIFTND